MKVSKLNGYLLSSIIAMLLCVGIAQAAPVYGYCNVKNDPKVENVFGNAKNLEFWWIYNDETKITATSFGIAKTRPNFNHGIIDKLTYVSNKENEPSWSFIYNNQTSGWDIHLDKYVLKNATCTIEPKSRPGYEYLTYNLQNLSDDARPSLSSGEEGSSLMRLDPDEDVEDCEFEVVEGKKIIYHAATPSNMGDSDGSPLLNRRGAARRCCSRLSLCSVS